MTTVLIIVCIVFCVAIVLGLVAHLGIGIKADKSWRTWISRRQAGEQRSQRTITPTDPPPPNA